MAQVDFVNYFSILFWFFLLFIFFYIIIYCYIIPAIYSILYIRSTYYKSEYNKTQNKFNFYPKYKSSVSVADDFILSLWALRINSLYGNS